MTNTTVFFFFFFLLNKETLLKIKTFENFQIELEGNRVDYTIKPKPYNEFVIIWFDRAFLFSYAMVVIVWTFEI